MLEQAGNVRIPLVHILHQQGPVAVRGLGEIGFAERAGVDVPAVALFVVHDQAGQRGRFARQAGEIVRLQRRLEVREGLANQQRTLLPVVAQETGG